MTFETRGFVLVDSFWAGQAAVCSIVVAGETGGVTAEASVVDQVLIGLVFIAGCTVILVLGAGLTDAATIQAFGFVKKGVKTSVHED